MVKHAARRKKASLHQFLLEKEAQERAKRESKLQKKALREAQEKLGSDGVVKALDAVKFTGKFGVNFQEAAVAAGQDEGMDVEESAVNNNGLMKSMRKKDALSISKQNYLIKKKEKKERQKIKRANKTGRIVKKMET